MLDHVRGRRLFVYDWDGRWYYCSGDRARWFVAERVRHQARVKPAAHNTSGKQRELEQMRPSDWRFDVPPEAVVITTCYVTRQGMPILYVSHESGDEDEILWQFHCGNGDFRSAVLQLVRLDEVLRLDAGIAELADLPLGFCAKRASPDHPWTTEKDVGT